MTMQQAIDLLLTEVLAEQSTTSQHTYNWHARELLKYWGPDRELTEITRLEVQVWLNSMRQKCKPATLRHKLSAFTRLFRIATDETGILHEPPTKQIRKPRLNNQRERVLSDQEEARLRHIMTPLEFSIIDFALQTGLRRLEQWSLKPDDVQLWWADIDPSTGAFGPVLLGMAHVVTSKTGKGRHVPLNPVAAHIAHDWKERGAGGWLFPPGYPNRLIGAAHWTRYKFLSKCAQANILGLRWHDLRHTFASRSLQGGARMEDISRVLGHTNLSMTQRYAHWTTDLLWPAAMAGLNRPAARQASPVPQQPDWTPVLSPPPVQGPVRVAEARAQETAPPHPARPMSWAVPRVVAR